MTNRYQFNVCVLVLQLLLFHKGIAQFPPIDSVRREIISSADDPGRAKAILGLTRYMNSVPVDTLSHYFKEASLMAARTGDQSLQRWASYVLAACELKKGHTEKVISLIDTARIFQFKQSDDQPLYYKLKLLKANALNRLNERLKALDLQYELLRQAEKDGYLLAQTYLLNYIGATYLNTGRTTDAREQWLKGLQLIREHPSKDFDEIETVIHSNLILYYFNLLDSGRNKLMTDSFLYYTNRSIDLSRRHQVYWIEASALTYRGDYYAMAGRVNEGEQDFNQAVAIRNLIGDPLYTTNDLIRLASFFLHQKKYDSSISVLHRAMKEMKRGHLSEPQMQILALLSVAYKSKGDYRAYSQSLEQFILDADTAYRLNAAEKMAEISTRYDVQKKEATIIRQQLELSRRFNYIVASLLLLAIAVPLTYFYIRRYKRTQAEKSLVAVKDAEEKERRRIAAELHDNIGVQANAILHNSRLLNDESLEREQLVNNLQETARDMLGNLRETVWALKRTDVTCAETWIRLIHFVSQVKRNFSDIQFSISGDTPAEQKITSIRALHLMMVVKESVHNAIRHSASATISIKSSYQDEWKIIIRDQGQGFDVMAKEGQPDSNGLLNMKERAAAGHFRVIVRSVMQQGTEVEICFPV